MPAGFLHHGRRVFALRYFLAAKAPLLREVIVWLRPDGYPEHGGVRRPDWPVVRTRPGDTLLVGGKKERVVAVEIYRADGLHVEY